MSEIERRPHPVFASLWGLLMLLSIVAGIIGLNGPKQGVFATCVLVAVAVLEAVAFIYDGPRKLRDTLSEITTWVNRKLSKHLKPVRGWNSLVAIQAIMLGRLLYVTGVYWGGEGVAPYALAVSALFAIGQHDHWLNPEDNG